ncbi:helix-turn-helix transcriptional regulator [Leptolyngbya cf. ectocarpi LEGE 11479]|uniref:Helix-turn-helix transcriptional regulator n=1 Tax=Leptolyngbya cf. ectocarpi LEGE 11479 TaxID=1828722 RepID=A0A928ZTA0_LEPEC|nr:AraC family transcriptional regulator [Leptolyngbya ectocarpi]MBE9066806.1 helix-turn-helix transcriptional regulator [Leptolyngbya cf. ectocarpi LEGE 11479]
MAQVTSSALQPRKIDRYGNLCPEDLLCSSISKSWQGFEIEQHQTSPGESPVVAYDRHLIAIQLTGHNTVRYDFDGAPRTHSFTGGGQVAVVPKGVPHQGRIQQDMLWIAIYLGSDFVTQAVYESMNTDRIHFLPSPPLRDPLIHQIGRCLVKDASAEDDQYGHLHAESLANTLAVHLIQNYATDNPIVRDYEDGLSRYQLKQAIDYIQANLDQTIKLADIATLLGMSQYYFCRLFRQSMGIPPYQYVIRQRVERAKQLLRRDRQVAISDISLECGFANQSHLSKHFRQLTGTTPKAYRRGQ